MKAISFLNNETGKDIEFNKKFKPIDNRVFGCSETSSLGLFQSKEQPTLKANRQARTKNLGLKAISEDYVVHLVARELSDNPNLVLSLKHGIVSSLPRIQQSILSSKNISINLYKAYVNSTRAKKKLPALLALAAKGILSFSDSDKLLVRAGAGMVNNQNKILFLTAKQQCSPDYKKTGKYCGTYKGKLAITRFSPSVINRLSASHKGNSGSTLFKWLVDSYNVKLEKISSRQNYLNEQFNYNALSAEEIADGLLEGTFDKEAISQCCSKSKIKEINNCIRNKCLI